MEFYFNDVIFIRLYEYVTFTYRFILLFFVVEIWIFSLHKEFTSSRTKICLLN